MQTADIDHNIFSTPRAGDDKLAIRFFIKAKQDGEASQAEGRPIFKEHEYIQIMLPGDRNSIMVRPVTPMDRGRFSQQYDHWKKTNNNDLAEGTPLESWGILNLAQIEEFRYFGIRTIEHMASVRDDLTAKVPGMQQLKQRAAEFMDRIKAEAPGKKMEAALASRDEQIKTLEAAVADQAQLIKTLQEQINKRK